MNFFECLMADGQMFITMRSARADNQHYLTNSKRGLRKNSTKQMFYNRWSTFTLSWNFIKLFVVIWATKKCVQGGSFEFWQENTKILHFVALSKYLLRQFQSEVFDHPSCSLDWARVSKLWVWYALLTYWKCVSEWVNTWWQLMVYRWYKKNYETIWQGKSKRFLGLQ